MKLSTQTDYALRMLMHLALHDDRLCTIAEVADRHGISHAHLMAVAPRLAHAGFLTTVRGKGGGIRLARPAAQITVGEVVRALEADLHLVECFADPRRCRLGGECRLAGALDDALQAFLQAQDRHTLAAVAPAAMLTQPLQVPARRSAGEARPS